jgi:hypothetical protein
MALFAIFSTHAQVGIGTTSPQETLHVNGTLRVNTTNQALTTTKIGGMDANGTFREVSVGTDLELSNNVLISTASTKLSFGEITLQKDLNGGSNTHNNVDLKLTIADDPLTTTIVEGNKGKTIIRIYGVDNITSNTAQDVVITGFKAGVDGQHIWIYAQSKKVTTSPNDAGSLAANRIEANVKKAAQVWGMIELVYDGARQLWIIMQHHS